MKVQNIKDVEKFFQVIDECEGTVELITGEGDRLNLKSKLCQYVSLTNIFSKTESEIPELEIIAHEQQDIQKIFNFMING
ncbi:polya polymerase [Lachnospiraceae bacterium ZAX-1]